MFISKGVPTVSVIASSMRNLGVNPGFLNVSICSKPREHVSFWWVGKRHGDGKKLQGQLEQEMIPQIQEGQWQNEFQ